jgi:hypothetical protein
MLYTGEDTDIGFEELTVVITAAIAASLNRSTHDIIVKPLTITNPITRPWNQIGRQDQIASRL